MRAYVIDTGYLRCDLSSTVLNPHMATVDDPNPDVEWTTIPVYAVLVDTGDRRILFDTGCHPDAVDERWSESQKAGTPFFRTDEQKLVNALGRIGYQPSDIDAVVVSHLHLDHSGGIEFFPDSEIYVHDAELKGALALYAQRAEEPMGPYVVKDIEKWLSLPLKWRPVTPDIDRIGLAPGVDIINFGPGHAFGNLGLHLSLEKTGDYIIASDAVNRAVNYGPPVRPNGEAHDTVGYRSTVGAIRRRSTEEGATVWFSHDPEQFATMTLSDDGFYE